MARQANGTAQRMARALILALAVGLCPAPGLAAEQSAAGDPVARPEADEATLDEILMAALDEAPFDRIMVIGHADNAERIPGAVQYIGEIDLERQEYDDIHRILRRVPGLNIQEEDGYGLRPNIGMRGSGIDRSSKITLMEDGVLFAPAPYAAPAAYFFPQSGRMEAVEVLKGASSIKFGPATTGGAINLVSTSIPEEFGGRVDARIGQDRQRQVHAYAGDSFDNMGFLVEAYLSQTDGFKKLDGGGNTGFDIEEYVAKARFATAEDAERYQELELKLGYTDQVSRETYLGLTDADFRATPFRRYAASQRDVFRGRHEQYQARYFGELTETLDLTTVVYLNRFDRDWFKLERVAGFVSGAAGDTSISRILGDPEQYAAAMGILRGQADSPADALLVRHNNRKYESYGVQSVLGWAWDGEEVSHDVEVSFRYHRDKMDRFQWFERFAMTGGNMVRTSIDVRGSDSNRIDRGEALSLYALDEISVGDWLIAPGLRYERIRLTRRDFGKADPGRGGANLKVVRNTVGVVIPGLGVTYDASDAWSLVAGVHKGFTPPAPGNTANEEKSVNFEAGARYRQGALAAEAIFFYNDYSNLIGTCTASTGGDCVIGDQFDGGDVRVTGLEVSASFDLGSWAELPFAVPVQVAYTLTDAEFRNSFRSSFAPFGNVEKGDSLPYTPRHQVFAGLGLSGTNWALDLNISFVGAVRNSAGQGPIPEREKIESHTVLDLSGRYQVTDQVKLFASVQNLTGTVYSVARRPAGLRPGKPGTFIAGLSLSF